MPKGPCTGPLVLAAIGVEEKDLKKIEALPLKDSKLLTPAQREDFEKKILDITKNFHLSIVPAQEIDSKRKVMSLNELEALKTAELLDLFPVKKKVIIDLPDPTQSGYLRRLRKYTTIDYELLAEHKADMNYKIVSAASILAKQERDRLVRKIEKSHSIVLGCGYSHDKNTINALKEYAKRRERPIFVRYSWITARRIWDAVDQKKLGEF